MKMHVDKTAKKFNIILTVRKDPGTESEADKIAPNATPIKFE